MSSRIIHLRRPAVLSPTEGPFVPPHARLDEIEARWEALCARNPAYFDGRICHVIGVHRNGYGGAVVHVMDCAYRFYAVQDAGFDLGVRALGVKGLTIRDDEVLVGRRSKSVAGYPGQWEFAPGGSVEPERDPADVITAELDEETGLSPQSPPVPLALVFDATIRTWELVFRLVTTPDDLAPRTDEYDELRWCRRHELPDAMTPVAREIGSLLEGPMARRHDNAE